MKSISKAAAAKPPMSPDRRDLKIAYIMSRFPKISETFVLYEILEQERLGNQVEVYPLLRERQAVMHLEAQPVVERAHYHPFLSLPIIQANLYFVRHRPLAYFNALREVLVGTFGSLNFFVGAVAYFPKAARFAREMQRDGVTHLHAHFCNHPALVALIIHRLTGIPFSFTAHGSDLHKDKRMLDQKVAASAFAVTISSFNKGEMLKVCGEPARDKIHIIHCGIDPEVFRPADGKSGEVPLRIVCVASLEEVKGHRYLVEACRRLRDAGIDFICDLIGDGPLRARVAGQIAESELGGRVIVHGSRGRDDVADMVRSADVKVLASVPTVDGKREGIPVAIMEAMACGLPVVASRLSGIPELVDHERTGLLVPPGDSEALFQALRRLSADSALRVEMGCAGREKVLREFDLRANVLELAKLFSA